MFTVKHISIGGVETLFHAELVKRVPEQTEGCQQSGPVAPENYVDLDNGTHLLHGGTVFVMNTKGATVSRWDMGASPVPLNDGIHGVTPTGSAGWSIPQRRMNHPDQKMGA